MMRPEKVYHKEPDRFKGKGGRPSSHNLLAQDEELDNCERLALCIVAQAAADFKALRRAGKPFFQDVHGTAFNEEELRQFFRSRWCNFLMSTTGMRGVDLLEMLEEAWG